MSSAAPAPRPRPLWWWALWLLLGAAMGMQALRMRIAEAAVNADAGARVVAIRPQNGWGQALLAERQFSKGDMAAATETSRRALDRTPLAVIAVRTLARVLDNKANAGGERAWQVASMMGWRDSPTQAWALLRALSNGEADVFVMRADALLRTGSDDPRMMSVIRQALTEPQIREAFLKRIALDPQWRSKLFEVDHPLTGRELEGSVLALKGLALTSAPPRREEIRNAIDGLIAGRRYHDALMLDRQLVRRSPDRDSLIDDGGFEQRSDYREKVTPFDWTMVNGAVIDQSEGRKSVLLIHDGRRAPLVRRLVALSPGAYRLSYMMKGQQASSGALGVRVRCAGNPDLLATSSRAPLTGDKWERRSVDFTVPGSCRLVVVELTALPGGQHTEAQFDDFRVVKRS